MQALPVITAEGATRSGIRRGDTRRGAVWMFPPSAGGGKGGGSGAARRVGVRTAFVRTRMREGWRAVMRASAVHVGRPAARAPRADLGMGIMLERFLFIWLMLLSLTALKWDAWVGMADPFAALAPVRAPLFAATMFFVGALLPRDELLSVLRRWPLVLAGTGVQYLSMPLIAWGLARLAGLEGDAFVGVALVGCVPGAMASNVLTLTARGNASFSVSLTTCATLCSPVVVPLALYVLLAGASVDAGVLARRAFVSLLWMVVGPVLLGYAVARLAENYGSTKPLGDGRDLWRRVWFHVGRFIRSHGSMVANLAILWIIASVVADNRRNLILSAPLLWGTLLGINLLGYAAGWSAATALRLDERERRALTLEVGMQNAGLGTVLAQQLFPGHAAIALPAALYTFGCMATGTLLAQWWSVAVSTRAGDVEMAAMSGGVDRAS
ncbi:MAG: bile acid:sodium symporter family protein [Planctomycetota bacterium]|nr:MAG: bile acid:sodium symporter family protein [Planctomycetota bacterium]